DRLGGAVRHQDLRAWQEAVRSLAFLARLASALASGLSRLLLGRRECVLGLVDRLGVLPHASDAADQVVQEPPDTFGQLGALGPVPGGAVLGEDLAGQAADEAARDVQCSLSARGQVTA